MVEVKELAGKILELLHEEEQKPIQTLWMLITLMLEHHRQDGIAKDFVVE